MEHKETIVVAIFIMQYAKLRVLELYYEKHHQPIRIELYVTWELSAWVEALSRLSAQVGSL